MQFRTKRFTALSALLTLGMVSAQQATTSQPSSTAPSVALESAAPAPATQRLSTVTLPFDAPAESRGLVIAQRLPDGATYQPGSSKLGNLAIADPQRGASGELYWVLPAEVRGVLSYDLSHQDALGALPQPALRVLLSGDRFDDLQGQIDTADFKAALSAKSALAPADDAQENDGAIKLPLEGSVIRLRDRINVVVEAPQGERPELRVNGLVIGAERIGTEVQDGVRGVQRLTYVGVPLQLGSNLISFGGQDLRVMRAGPAARIDVLPESLVADGSTPLRLKVRALDAYGNLANLATLTLRTNLEPRVADASTDPGYQIQMVDGEGYLEVQPQSAPTTLNLDILLGERVLRSRYAVVPDRSSVGVGMLSATLGLGHSDSPFTVASHLSWQARAYAETPIGAGKLYLAADKDGLPKSDNPNVRSPVLGDASTEQTPLQGYDPVAAVYDHPNFQVAYRQSALPISVLPVGEQLTALTFISKGQTTASGFVADVPSDYVSQLPLTPDGTRILRLIGGQILDSSETLELLTVERTTGKELRRVTLQRAVDYFIDYPTGIVTLARALDSVDTELNSVQVLASYRLAGGPAGRHLAYGAQVKHEGQNYTVGAAVVKLDGVSTFGARVTFDNGVSAADARVAYAGGAQVSVDAKTLLGRGLTRAGSSASLSARYQGAGYDGLAPFGVGLNVAANYTGLVTPSLGVVLDAEYHDLPQLASAVSLTPGTPNPTLPLGSTFPTATPDLRGGSLTGRADYRVGAFTVGAGAKYAFGDIYGVGVVGSFGYHRSPLDVDVVHTQPLTGNLDITTEVRTRYRISKNLTLGFSDKITWGIGQAAVLALDSILGNVNYAVGYELPTASGAGNRARFGVSTSWPLSQHISFNVRGSALYDMNLNQAQLGGGGDINYKTDTYSATAGTDLTLVGGQLGAVVRAGVTGSLSQNLTVTADGLAELGAEKNGQRLALGYAYRGRNLSSLGYLRYVNGTLAGSSPELSSGLSAEYHQPGWALRGGLDTRTLLSDSGSFTAQGYAGANVYLTELLGVGAWGRVLSQPGTHTTLYGYGLEASLRALPGTWLSAGYNFRGFEGLPSAGTYTRPGAYLRLDVTLDETLGQGKK